MAGLEDLAERLGVRIRYESLGDKEAEVNSGRFRLRGEDVILIDRRLNQAARLEFLCREIREMDLTGIYIKPYLRAILEKAGQETGLD